MDFLISAVFKHSAVLELENDTICFAEQEYSVSVNGTEVLRSRQNVICIRDLLPDTEYTIGISAAGGTTEKKLRTRAETALLDVRGFGAEGDGTADDTGALQAAILSCPEGGTVFFPAGTYLTRPLFQKSGTTLLLAEGAVIMGDPDRKHYPVLPGILPYPAAEDGSGEYVLASWEGNPESSFASLITAIGIHDLDIEGSGVIDGNAAAGDWWQEPKLKRTAWRPNTVFLNRCTGVRMAGITVRNSPAWTIHPFYSDHIAFYSLEITNPPDSPNTDGIDPESCRDVLILGTRISVGDDCIAIKSGKYYMSEKHHRSAEHIAVRNSILEKGHGAVTIGSEAAGGAADVEVSRCIFDGTDRGLRIKTRRGRGPEALYDRICFHNLSMRSVAMPFTVNMFYFCDPDGHSAYVQDQKPHPVDQRTPRIGSIRASDIVIEGADACILTAYGLPEMYIESIELAHIRASFRTASGRKKRQTIMMDDFPELSGKSFYARNVKRLSLLDVAVAGSDDTHPALIDVTEYDSKNVIYT